MVFHSSLMSALPNSVVLHNAQHRPKNTGDLRTLAEHIIILLRF
jgi:hypothetical protein